MDAIEVAEAMGISGLVEFAESYTPSTSVERARDALGMNEPVPYSVRMSGEGEI